MSINPWLAAKLTEYRSRHSDEEMRRDYETDCALGVNLSWDEYHQSRTVPSIPVINKCVVWAYGKFVITAILKY